MTEAEIKAKRAEYARKWREEHKDEVKAYRKRETEKKRALREQEKAAAAKQAQTKLQEIAAIPEFFDAVQAAQINQKHRLSYICGSAIRGKRCYILEKLAFGDGPLRYRLKETRYNYFSSLAEAKNHCEARGIRFYQLSDLTEESNPWS